MKLDQREESAVRSMFAELVWVGRVAANSEYFKRDYLLYKKKKKFKYKQTGENRDQI